jgi:DNA-binding NtrC family response regulator
MDVISSNNKSILLAIDQFKVARVIGQYIERRGFNTVAFADPLVALEHLRNYKRYSVIITDNKASFAKEFDFIKEAKKIHPIIKIVMICGAEVNIVENAKDSSDLKVDGFIEEPASIEKLKSVIDRHC